MKTPPMGKITTVKVSRVNWKQALTLDVLPEQRHFVPKVTLSLAMAYIRPEGLVYEPYGICEDNNIVGFYTLMYDPDSVMDLYLGSFLVDARFQRKGIGREAVKQLCSFLPKRFMHAQMLYASVHPENKGGNAFLAQTGFAAGTSFVDGKRLYSRSLTE